MTFNLRPATPADLPFRAALHNALFPGEPTTLADLQRQDETRRADLIQHRFIAEVDGQPAGQGLYTQQEWMFHPQKFLVNVQVGRDHQGQGIGKRLWEKLESELRALDAVKLFASVREDETRARRFLSERGFTEEQRERVAVLSLADADLSAFDAAVNRVQAQGYTLMTFAEWSGPTQEGRLYAFDREASQDTPRPADEVFDFPTPERYWERIRADPTHDPSLWFVAVRDGELAGLSQLQTVAALPEVLSTGLTATARAHRRRGLALALKLTALTEAKKRGYRRVRTENDATNAPMIAINDALGFAQTPARLWLTRLRRPPAFSDPGPV
ncbi:GNAT family N-acetyltransferase [Deinococcus alpinitundrae]|uniref:GNAT family N-acetyltransferase n=1 Tax=Deinococcus alpinitundrae TaxID=468913 RepID=UPI00137A9DBC|nr:GNAT family N-acetyltransferase [Deinococcus alpinitundrae]